MLNMTTESGSNVYMHKCVSKCLL